MPVYDESDYDKVLERIKRKLRDKEIELNSPASEEDIIAFENACEITFPLAFRRFLKEVGNGGTMLYGFHLNILGEDIELIDLTRPFMLKDAWIWEDEHVIAEQIEIMAYNGIIELIDVGCNQIFCLIATGECRGEVWFFTEVGVQPCCERQDFLGWFEKWLEEGDKVDYFSDYEYT